MLDKFLKNFPPPKYLDAPYAGIAFSDSSIRILTLDKKNKHPIFFEETTLPLGIIEMGKIKNEEALIKILTDIRAGLKTPFVKFSMPDETSYVFTAKVPVTPSGDAKESVSFILEENVPLLLADTSFDFDIQKIDETSAGYFAQITVIASATSLVMPYVLALQKADFEPLACTSESEATVYAVMPKNPNVAGVAIHVHRQSVGLYIASGYRVEFSAVIPISVGDATEIKVQAIKAELLKAVNYWLGKRSAVSGSDQLLPCYLCGRSEMLNDILLQINQIPKMKALIADVWSNAFSLDEFVPEMPFETSLRFASAVGLFLDD